MYLETENGVQINSTTKVFTVKAKDFESDIAALERVKKAAKKYAAEKRSYIFNVMEVKVVKGKKSRPEFYGFAVPK